jgi:hypothetical protein
MSDTNLNAIVHRFRNLEIIDEAWIKDSLSDDDIDVPKDVLLDDFNDDDEDEDDDNNTQTNAADLWGDLGLDRFLQELSEFSIADSALQTGRSETGTTGTAQAPSTAGGAGAGTGDQQTQGVGSPAATPQQ